MAAPAANPMFATALELHQQGQLDQARAAYETLLSAQPAHADALHMLGVLALQTGQAQQAQELIARALAVQPQRADAHYNQGLACMALGRVQAALQCYDRAIALQPGYAQAHYNRGVALQDLGLNQEALPAYDTVASLQPDHVQAHMNRGNVLRALQRHAEALGSYDRAIALQPGYAQAHYNRGVALQDLNRHAQALASFDQAMRHGGGFAQLHNNRGNALLALRRFTEALACYDAALRVLPDYADAHCNRAIVLQELKQYAAAVQSFDCVLALEPDRAFVRGLRLHLKMQLADWSDFDAEQEQLVQQVLRSKPAVPPIAALAMVDLPMVQRHVAAAWSRHMCGGVQTAGAVGAVRQNGRIRVAYYSADFHNHATMHLLARVLELHDKSRFETFAFSFGPVSQDAMRLRVAAAFDHFIEVGAWPDAQVAQHSRQLQIDIAVDLKGYSYQSRPAIFAHRAAPVQVNLIGHPGTMATPSIDYIIADRMVIPEHRQDQFVEKLVYLPHSYQPNDDSRAISEHIFSRMEQGLPEQGFVFCCFNATYKITPCTFDGWMRILRGVDGGVLWLLESQPQAKENMRDRARRNGIDPSRLVFAPALAQAEHLARHRCADLFLDTVPCNAHTTASDALWAGLPVLTLRGEIFASRVAASLLAALGLPELITDTQAEYESLAIALAQSPARLEGLRSSLAARRLSAPLFDTERYTRQLERAYVAMTQRNRAGLPPQHIEV